MPGLTGCSTTSPLDGPREQALRQYVVDSVRREIADPSLRPEPRLTERPEEQLPIDQRFYPELERMAGPTSRDMVGLGYGEGLIGLDARPVPISLRHAVVAAVENNLEVQFARLAPAISETEVVAAEAAFDWVLFSNATWNNLDQVSPGASFAPGRNQRQSVQNETGIRRSLVSGGQFAVQQELIYTDFEAGQNFQPDPATQAALTFQVDQPLLRNFGTDVNLAQVRINRNLERDAIAQLRAQLLETVNQTETTYWGLVRAQHDLAILQSLLERGIITRDQLQTRLNAGLDVPPSQLADAVARVQRRMTDVTRARDAIRDASDRLKLLMNDPEYPVGSEIILVPLDAPLDEAISFSLLSALTTAIQNRPEVNQAVLSMDSASIREVVAANQRLPQLNLQLQARFQGLDDGLDAVNEQFDGDFVDYVLGLTFEQPIGNRAAEALYLRRRLEREQTLLSYRNTLQQIVFDVKNSLRAVVRNFEIIGQARQSRIAATEALRTLQVENQQIREMSSERLELEFSRQEALANAEREEMAAITDFNAAVAQLYASMGTALERNNIEFVVPTAEMSLTPRFSADYWASWDLPGRETSPPPPPPPAEAAPDAADEPMPRGEDPQPDAAGGE